MFVPQRYLQTYGAIVVMIRPTFTIHEVRCIRIPKVAHTRDSVGFDRMKAVAADAYVCDRSGRLKHCLSYCMRLLNPFGYEVSITISFCAVTSSSAEHLAYAKFGFIQQ